jgi:predicted secreted protein
MTFTTGLVVYVMIWVIVLFLVLPWAVRIPNQIEQGHADSAPEMPYIGLKFLITSVLSIFFWVIAYLVLRNH